MTTNSLLYPTNTIFKTVYYGVSWDVLNVDRLVNVMLFAVCRLHV